MYFSAAHRHLLIGDTTPTPFKQEAAPMRTDPPTMTQPAKTPQSAKTPGPRSRGARSAVAAVTAVAATALAMLAPAAASAAMTQPASAHHGTFCC
jgi:hypothetical protein